MQNSRIPGHEVLASDWPGHLQSVNRNEQGTLPRMTKLESSRMRECAHEGPFRVVLYYKSFGLE